MSSNTILIISNGAYGFDRWKTVLSGGDISILRATALDLMISQFESDSFDVMIVEASGHEEEDIELCARLRLRYDVPLLLLSPYLAESVYVAAYGAGVDECISGPISDALLRAKVHVWLNWTKRSPFAQDNSTSNVAELQTERASGKV